jgi:hypothetical protein
MSCCRAGAEATTLVPECHVECRVVDEIFLLQNFVKYLFRISQNNFFHFAKKKNFVSQKVTQFRKIFVTKLNF